MPIARYQRIVTVTEEENKIIEELLKKGVKVIDIFRTGIEKLSKEKLK